MRWEAEIRLEKGMTFAWKMCYWLVFCGLINHYSTNGFSSTKLIDLCGDILFSLTPLLGWAEQRAVVWKRPCSWCIFSVSSLSLHCNALWYLQRQKGESFLFTLFTHMFTGCEGFWTYITEYGIHVGCCIITNGPLQYCCNQRWVKCKHDDLNDLTSCCQVEY